MEYDGSTKTLTVPWFEPAVEINFNKIVGFSMSSVADLENPDGNPYYKLQDSSD